MLFTNQILRSSNQLLTTLEAWLMEQLFSTAHKLMWSSFGIKDRLGRNNFSFSRHNEGKWERFFVYIRLKRIGCVENFFLLIVPFFETIGMDTFFSLSNPSPTVKLITMFFFPSFPYLKHSALSHSCSITYAKRSLEIVRKLLSALQNSHFAPQTSLL